MSGGLIDMDASLADHQAEPKRPDGFGHEAPNQGKTNEWLTPPSIIQALGPFDLDPCAPPADIRPWPTATIHYTEAQDGLSLPWTGFVWCNPPYGPHTGDWLARCADHGQAIALVFARTETKAFFDSVWPRANAVLFIRRRVNFHTLDGQPSTNNSGAPSCLIGYGLKAVNRLYQQTSIEGRLVRL